MNRYRHEYKYLLSAAQMQLLQLWAAGLLAKDPHADKTGAYLIHSLYFDDLNDTCLQENLAGTDHRAKFRIRYYNQDTSYLRLEKKSKLRGMTQKEACDLTEAECRSLMQGQIPPILPDMPPQKHKLLTQLQLGGLIPKVIVSYLRTPLVYPGGNVRVTFDQNISSSNDIAHFLDGNYPTRPILPPGQCVLEVKWDEVLPRHIYTGLALDQLQWSAFSKYCLCRRYHL